MIKRSKIIIFVILIIILECLIIKVVTSKDRMVVKYYEKYKVQSGDTLDSITNKYPHGNDKQQFQYIIKDTNGITSLIYEGQEILVPIIEQR